VATTNRLVLATSNPNKAREMREMLDGCGWDIAAAPPDAADVEETGATFEENARLKALAVAKAAGAVALADDSGLAVDALNGAPGIRSRRWAGEDADDSERNARLLEALTSVPSAERTARFVCAACIASPDGVLWEGAGEIHGRVADAPRGHGGFVYDPVFLLPDGRTMAELSAPEKNAVSHRGRALRAASAWLASQSG
jgi:XTP/dITP diphosphohydrolase